MTSSILHADELSDLRKENESLKREVAELRRQTQSGTVQSTAAAPDRKAGIRAKFEKNKKTYSEEQLREIEQLYQFANKDLKSPEAKKTLNIRLYLSYYFKEIGKEKESKALFDEIRKDYPDAVNHKGKLLIDMLPKSWPR